MNIALVSANNYQVPYPVYPLGVSYLHTYLSQHLPGSEIRLFDFNLGSFDEFAAFLQAQPFDFVGISLRNIDDTNIFEKNNFIAHYKKVMEVARAHTQALIILGGPGFSVFPEQVFEALNPDYAVQGEGEESLCRLIDGLASGSGRIHEIEGLVYRNGNDTLTVNPRTTNIASPVLHVDDTLAAYYWEKSGMLNIQTKRGCPYNCIYCSYPVIDGRKVRTLEAETVVRNIEELYHRKGIRYLFFTDSIFNIHKEYNHELAHRLIESKVKVRWGAYFSPHNLALSDLELYQQSGLTHIEFGTDSFSDQQLENYNKNFRFQDVLQQSARCGKLGIFYAHFLILGGYGETEQSLDETFERSKEVGTTVIFPYVGMRIYPRTKLCEIALQEGLIHDTNDLISPVYYVSPQIDLHTLKARAGATGQKWVFPDDEPSPLMERFREKKRRGPLWEYLRF